MKILLLQAPWGSIYGSYASAARVGNCYPPLGLCYISSVLKKEGHVTKIIDAELEGKNIGDILNEIEVFRPDLIGFTSTTPLFAATLEIASKIKEKMDVLVVVGGPHVTVMPDDIVKPDRPFDFAVYGEGEITMRELVNSIVDGKGKYDDIPGLIFKCRNGEVKKNQSRCHIEDINGIPMPDREALMLEKYVWSVPGKGVERFTTLMTERGCPFNCTFCSTHTVFGKKVRYREVDSIVSEIEHLVNDLNIRHIAFIDDTLTLNKDRVIDMCQKIINKRLDFTWEGWTRANTINDELVEIMAKAGFRRVSFGIESGSPAILKGIKKGIKLEDVVNGFKIMKKYGIETRGSVMIGHPNETSKTANETLRFIRGLHDCDQIYINITTPYPGTELYRQVINGEGGLVLLERDFSKYKRYGNAVIKVNDLSPKDLIGLQRKGFMMFYFTPRRIWYNFKRAGLKAFIKNAIAFTKSVILK